MMDDVIEVRGLVKRFGDRTVVDKVSMAVQTGEIAEPAPDGATGWHSRRVSVT